MELVFLDFWSGEDGDQHLVDLLVIIDHFTKLTHAFQCANKTAKIAKKPWDHIFFVFVLPDCVQSDQGANFESELIEELFRFSGVPKSHTSAYHEKWRN